MNASAGRRAFLRGDFKIKELPRPLGMLNWTAFTDSCTQCGDCIQACPEDVLMLDRDGFPYFNVDAGACTFCMKCVDKCPTEALQAENAWPWIAELADTCLATQGVQCRACEDFCDERAIRFKLQLGGTALPQLDTDACTGCGGCVSPCPVDAFSLVRRKPLKEEKRIC